MGIELDLIRGLNAVIRRVAAWSHRLQFRLEWRGRQPEWFDHFIDQFWQWRYKEISHWVERGVFGSVALSSSSSVLELCCGDGFNARHFYVGRSANVVSVDFDQSAIEHAAKYNAHPRIEYRLADIRTDMPSGEFDNVIWDAAIEHFTEVEIGNILHEIRRRLRSNGVLSGFTIVERSDGKKQLDHHEYEFKSKKDLERILEPYFERVAVFETIHPTRHNLYFYCSDGEIPFAPDWSGWATSSSAEDA